MKDQLKTIRAGVAEFAEGDGQKGLGMILGAVAQLEAMVGEQEPEVCGKCHGTGYYDEGHECDDGTMAGGNYVVCDKCSAPVAQQPQAPTESVLIDGIAYDIPAPVAAELLRLHIEARQPQAEVVPCGSREYCGRFPFCGCGNSDSLPERDTTKPAEQQGLFRKFVVRRTDGSDAPGGKHDGCDYFVLDVTHDKHAKAALAAYAASVEETHPQLATDMRDRYGLAAPQQAEAVPPDVVRDAERYRWLRQEHERHDPLCHLSWKQNSNRNGSEWVNTANLDAAIDAAIAQQKGGM